MRSGYPGPDLRDDRLAMKAGASSASATPFIDLLGILLVNPFVQFVNAVKDRFA